MTRATQSYLCSCGAHHPVGSLCDRPEPAVLLAPGRSDCGCGRDHGPDHPESEAEPEPPPPGPGAATGPDALEHSPPPRRACAHCSGGSQEQAAAGPLDDMPEMGQASATRAIYRIVNMDCPVEEALIRQKLASLPGVNGLEFNLMRRILTVNHELPSTGPIEAALNSIDLKPEPLSSIEGQTAVFSVDGMDCPTEENLIRTKLGGLPGVLGLDFNLMRRRLKVRYEPGTLPAISEALLKLNLGARLIEAGSDESRAVPAPQIPWKRLAAAGALAAFSEVFELLGEWGVKPWGFDFKALTIGGLAVGEWLPLILAVGAILTGGLTTYKKGWIAVKNLNLNMNALMSVAVTGAVIIGQYPEAAMVMVLFNLAEAIEAKALDRARKAIKNLLSLTPEKALVQQADGAWVEMDIRQVAVNSRVRVKPGERVALDGVILEGGSTIDQSPITGESLPVEKNPGDVVYAGSINEAGSFEFRVTAGAGDTTLARIIHAVEEAQSKRAPTQRLVDRFAKIYTPAIFLTAFLVAAVPPLLLGEAWAGWIYTALVILVIGCPCALVISTPVSIVSGLAAATRHGILIKGGLFLEKGRHLQWLALDKTGTITYGRPRQTDFLNLGPLEAGQAAALAFSLAARSDHPVSRAIAEKAAEDGFLKMEVTDFKARPGQGISGIIEGRKWHLGNHQLVEELKKGSPGLEEQISGLERQGKSVVALVGAQGAQALFAVADTIKESSIEAIKELKEMGLKTIMLTGDNQHTARAIAERAGVDSFKANLLPEDKLAAVERLAESGQVGMVGDGINDAPALARAAVGFAMAAAGTGTAIETADVALMDDDLRKIPRFIRLSQATYAILAQNITLALAVKAVFLVLAFRGQATMWMAVFADMGTSLLVVANGLRAMRR